MEISEHIVTIKNIIDTTPKVKLFQVENPGVDYKAGQFFMVSLVDDEEVKVARAYSVASSPANKEIIEIGFDKVGVLTTKFFEMKEGDKLKFKGPYGKFFFDESFDGDVLLIAAGTGITPMMSIARLASDKQLPNRMRLLYSVKTPEDIVYPGEYEEHKKTNGQFDYEITVTRPDGVQWDGCTGRIGKDLVASHLSDAKNTQAYLCGPKEFVFCCIDLLKELGMEKENIKTDVWG